MTDLNDAFGGTSLPDDSFNLKDVNPINPYDDVQEVVKEIFSDNRRVGGEKRPYEF